MSVLETFTVDAPKDKENCRGELTHRTHRTTGRSRSDITPTARKYDAPNDTTTDSNKEVQQSEPREREAVLRVEVADNGAGITEVSAITICVVRIAVARCGDK